MGVYSLTGGVYGYLIFLFNMLIAEVRTRSFNLGNFIRMQSMDLITVFGSF